MFQILSTISVFFDEIMRLFPRIFWSPRSSDTSTSDDGLCAHSCPASCRYCVILLHCDGISAAWVVHQPGCWTWGTCLLECSSFPVVLTVLFARAQTGFAVKFSHSPIASHRKISIVANWYWFPGY